MGVSAAYLASLVSDPRINATMTTSDVCKLLVHSPSPTINMSYCDWLQQQGHTTAANGQPSVGHARYFVSHAWQYRFVDVVATILYFHSGLEKSEQQAGVYFWFDVFSVNQFSAPKLSHAWWSTTFLSAIEQFGQTLLVLMPWDKPVLLTRAWCLWEIYATIKTQSTLHVGFPPNEMAAFRRGIETDHMRCIEEMAALDVSQGKAFREEDRAMIMQAIVEHVGVEAMNTLVRTRLLGVILCGACRQAARSGSSITAVTALMDAGADVNTVASLLTPLGVAGASNMAMWCDVM